MEPITLNNYEEYLISYADGELQPHEARALMAFLEENPLLKKELELYSELKLQPDPAVVFTAKETMLQQEDKHRTILLPHWRRYAAAAAIVAIAIVSGVIIKEQNDGQAGDVVTVKSTVTTPVTTTKVPSDSVAGATVTAASVVNDSTGANPGTMAPGKPTVVQSGTVAAAVRLKSMPEITRIKKHEQLPAGNNINSPRKVTATAKNENETTMDGQDKISRKLAMEKLAVSGLNQLPVAAIAPAKHTPETDPTVALHLPSSESKKNWIDLLPLTDAKKEQLNTMATTLGDGIEEVHTLKEQIREKSLTIKVREKKFILSF